MVRVPISPDTTKPLLKEAQRFYILVMEKRSSRDERQRGPPALTRGPPGAPPPPPPSQSRSQPALVPRPRFEPVDREKVPHSSLVHLMLFLQGFYYSSSFFMFCYFSLHFVFQFYVKKKNLYFDADMPFAASRFHQGMLYFRKVFTSINAFLFGHL